MKEKAIMLIVFILMISIALIALGQDEPKHLFGSSETTIVPEIFLRGYDPITVFFSKNTGPEGGGPEDEPGNLLKINPDHPGEYRWLDAKTLQFLPTIPWPALMSFTITVEGKKHKLITLMSAPKSISPSNGSRDLEPIKEMTLSFPDRLGLEELSAMLSFEVKPLPGVDVGTGLKPDSTTLTLTNRDFTLKEIERSSIQNAVQYQLTFHKPIPYGKALIMNLRLSLDEKLEGSFAHSPLSPFQRGAGGLLKGARGLYTFATKPVFRLTGIGAESIVYPVAVKGSVYSVAQAIHCGPGGKPLFLQFSHSLGTVSLAEVKQLVRFTPSVKNFRFEVSGKRLYLYFDAERDKAYKLELQETPLQDVDGRELASFGETAVFFHYSQAAPYLQWGQSQGILERYGPQKFPMEGRGEEQVDIRIYKIDPLDRNFWPFPNKPVVIDENKRPAGPGEEPAFATNMPEQIKLLGSPLISRLLPLPMKDKSGRLKFGLGLKELLAKISGKEQPGTYLLGYREISSSTERRFVRTQVTDLSLSTVEEESAVNFVVTSLKTGNPVSGAKIVVEGRYHRDNENIWKPIISGITNSNGQYRYTHTKQIQAYIRRIVVSYRGDILVLNPDTAPPHFLDNHWYSSSSTWLSWLRNMPRKTKERAVRKVHIFTERPVYRPEEPVHIKGYLRLRQKGLLIHEGERVRSLVVTGPGNKRWTYPLSLTEHGSFYHKFEEEDLPTGEYQVSVLDEHSSERLGFVTFKKESYRIPRFEIRISGPDRVAMDAPFELTMTADYYAGGRVVGQEVTWQVTQFQYRFRTPTQYPGFLFSADERFGASLPFRSSGSTIKQDTTDENGSSILEINPALEPDGRPRRYVVEVTVRGADEQTVTTTKTVLALPACILGIKIDRFLKNSQVIKPEMLVLAHDEKPLAGLEFRLRLMQRQWHSYLKESDFTTGKAKYVTDVVDVPLIERTLISTAEPITLELPVQEAGVYVVEIAAQDKLGRLQKVIADLYVAGDTPVAWKQPKTNVFETSLDKDSYIPGEEANLLLKSPFQQARALIIVEAPSENRYHWVEIQNAQGIFTLPITGDMNPRLPVHALLLRGRLEQMPPQSPSPPFDKGGIKGGFQSDEGGTRVTTEDIAKPIAMAATAWIKVEPRDNQLKVEVEHPLKNLPGASMPMKIKLSDPDDNPLNGEVTLWLVDRAVLALGTEQRLDPVPSFIDAVPARIRIRETRNEVVGDLIVEEVPGGDGAKREHEALFGKVTVRKTFKSVPYYNPTINVVDGTAELTIELPDNLTDFAVRAVATDGDARFGYAKSMLSIRLPLIVQSALPRFVRPGDKFVAGGIGRVVEGEGGPGVVQLQVEGLEVKGEMSRTVEWVKDLPEQLYFPMEVVLPAPVEDEENKVTVRIAVKREVDGAMDAFEVKLPIKKDREKRRLETFVQVKPDEIISFPIPDEEARAGTISQSALLTYEPALVKMLAGLNYLARYEYFCTEQRISQLFPELALKELLEQIDRGSRSEVIELSMSETFTYLANVLQPNGLYSYWPGSRGYVSLTAYVVEFLLMAKEQGYSFNEKLLERGITALKESLRSDYSNFIDGYSFVERAEALNALAKAGDFQDAYAHDLFARASNMDLYSEAKILHAFLTEAQDETSAIDRLAEDLWMSLVFALRDGKEVYQGLQYRAESWGGLINSSEVKTLASVAQSLYRGASEEPRVRLLIDELISRGEGDGWGSTNANAAALLALGELLELPAPTEAGHLFTLTFEDEVEDLDTTGKAITHYQTDSPSPGELSYKAGAVDAIPLAWLSLIYMPANSGDQVKQKNEGFVVDREILIIQDSDEPPVKHQVKAGEALELDMGTIVEEHIQVINPETHYFVAVRAPFAAGFEPMNPNLATSPKEAKPAGTMTLQPSYAQYEDDQVTFYYDTLPKGTYDFYFRLRASIQGGFVHPPAKAEMMYKETVRGHSDGTRIAIKPGSKD